MGGEARLPLPGWNQSCGRTLDNHYRHLDFDVVAVVMTMEMTMEMTLEMTMVMTAMMTKALTDSLTRPLAEERAGNVGRTPCCRAS